MPSEDKQIIDLRKALPENVQDAEVEAEYSNVFLEWEAPEYEVYPKPKYALAIAGGLALLVFGYSLYAGNYFLSVLVVLATFLVHHFAHREPKIVNAALTSQGVVVGNRIFVFDDLKSFWIFYEPEGIKELSLESKKAMIPFSRVPLGEVHPVKVREYLIRYVPERQHEISFVEEITRYLGF